MVRLQTLPQSNLLYTLKVVALRDEAGNPLASPDGSTDLTTARFVGIAPRSGDFVDSDGDGLTDDAEQRGWIVKVTEVGGAARQIGVNSDPLSDDTDADQIRDPDERKFGTDPRNRDTDGDGLPDLRELSDTYSHPTSQDTDGDDIDDGREATSSSPRRSSPTQTATSFTDSEELFRINRNPRVADLPRPRISVGDVALRLDTRFSFTDTEGRSRTSEESVSSTLENTESTSFSRSDSSTTERVIENTLKLGIKQDISAEPGVTLSAENELKFSFTNTESTTVERESAQSASKTFEQSLSTSQTVDETREVTREVKGGSVQVPVTVANVSDIPFTMRNLEIAVLVQDPVQRTRFLPVATLVPEVALTTDEIPPITAGPFLRERGPFVFTSRDVFPSLVEDLLRNPRGLVFEVANFDVTDERGRNLAFTSQVVNDRTAGVVIDFGDRTEHYRVATTSGFDPEGRPLGISWATRSGTSCDSRKTGRRTRSWWAPMAVA